MDDHAYGLNINCYFWFVFWSPPNFNDSTPHTFFCLSEIRGRPRIQFRYHLLYLTCIRGRPRILMIPSLIISSAYLKFVGDREYNLDITCICGRPRIFLIPFPYDFFCLSEIWRRLRIQFGYYLLYMSCTLGRPRISMTVIVLFYADEIGDWI